MRLSRKKKRDVRRGGEPFMSLIQVVQGHRAQCTLVDCSPRIHRSFLFPDMVHAALPRGAWQCVTLCVCMCVSACCPNLHPSAPPADCKPSGPPAIQVDCLSLLTGCMILQINTNYISTRLPWTPSTESASGPYLIIPQRCRLYVSTEQQRLVVLCSARQLNPSERQFTFPTLFAVYSNSFKSNQSIK